MPTLIIIDGIIANGKTTLINQLIDNHSDWIPISEGVPLDNSEILSMTDPSHKEFIELFIQTKVAMNYQLAMRDVNSNNILIADRIFSAAKYWGKYYGKTHSDYVEFLICQIRKLLKDVKIIYVNLVDSNTDKRVLMKNIRMRSRDFEQDYTPEKLNKLESIYNQSIQDLYGLDYEEFTFEVGQEFYNNSVEIIEAIIGHCIRLDNLRDTITGLDEVD